MVLKNTETVLRKAGGTNLKHEMKLMRHANRRDGIMKLGKTCHKRQKMTKTDVYGKT